MSSDKGHKLSNTSNNYQEVPTEDEAKIIPLKTGNSFLQFAATISGKNIFVSSVKHTLLHPLLTLDDKVLIFTILKCSLKNNSF